MQEHIAVDYFNCCMFWVGLSSINIDVSVDRNMFPSVNRAPTLVVVQYFWQQECQAPFCSIMGKVYCSPDCKRQWSISFCFIMYQLVYSLSDPCGKCISLNKWIIGSREQFCLLFCFSVVKLPSFSFVGLSSGKVLISMIQLNTSNNHCQSLPIDWNAVVKCKFR